jgi:Heterokaryon incompatibility protein (HET)
MRLLKRSANGALSLTEDLTDDNIPRSYAILSHRWETGEVTFEDMENGTGENKAGFKKLQFCGDQAARHGLEYFWVDTCCINKSNNVELQYAINSMFRWYRDAAKCYVYLSDVSTPYGPETRLSDASWESAFRNSRWFTRGWTLQELIAPSSVEFFSKESAWLGDKKSLERQVCEITGIPVNALQGSPLSNFSVTERFSWINRRDTKYQEDKAYSLLGIFGVFMSLNYGEGKDNAFRRLQEEIEKALKGKS